jgi:hypothetical protein
MSFQRKGPQLPAELSEELGLKPKTATATSTAGQRHEPYKPKSKVLGRKDARKAAREEKKQSKRPQPQNVKRGQLKVIGKGISAQQIARAPAREQAKKLAAPVAHAKSSIKGKEKANEPAQAGLPAQPSKKRKRSSEASPKHQGNGDIEQQRPKTKEKETSFQSTSKVKLDVLPKEVHQKKRVSSSTITPLQRLLAKAEGGQEAAQSSSALSAPSKRKKRSQMTQAERDEEDEIAWLEAHLAAKAAGKKTAKKGDDDELEDDGLDGGCSTMLFSRFKPAQLTLTPRLQTCLAISTISRLACLTACLTARKRMMT